MRDRRPIKMALGPKEQAQWRAARAYAHYVEWSDAVFAARLDGVRVYELDFQGWSR